MWDYFCSTTSTGSTTSTASASSTASTTSTASASSTASAATTARMSNFEFAGIRKIWRCLNALIFTYMFNYFNC